MNHRADGFTMIMGGVDRSAEFRRDDRAERTDRRMTAVLLFVIAVLMAMTGWLASVVLIPQVEAAAPATGMASKQAQRPAGDRDRSPPELPANSY